MADYETWSSIEDFEVYKDLERLCDEIWKLVAQWPHLAQDTVGKQLVRALDSICANLSEGDGRFHHRETLNYYYISRGSLKESRYWLRRSLSRGLIDAAIVEDAQRRLEAGHRWLNTLISQRRRYINSVKEDRAEYDATLDE